MIFTHAVVRGDGRIDHLRRSPSGDGVPQGCGVVALALPVRGWPAAPSPAHELHCTTAGVLSWQDPRTLAQQKSDKWAQIKAAREAAIDAPFATPYGAFDADAAARANITDAVLMLQTLAGTGSPTTIDFTLADNTVVTLTTAQMVEVGLLLGQKVQAAFATARGLRTAIEAATTAADVDAIAWPGA